MTPNATTTDVGLTPTPVSSVPSLLRAFAGPALLWPLAGLGFAGLLAVLDEAIGQGPLPADLLVASAVLGASLASGVGRPWGAFTLERRHLPFQQRLVALDAALCATWMTVVGIAALAAAGWLGLPGRGDANVGAPWVFWVLGLAGHYDALPARGGKWTLPALIAAGTLLAEVSFSAVARDPAPVSSVLHMVGIGLCSLALCGIVWRETPPDLSTR